ncbi:MAG: 3-deoxy-D-manno-octulosonate 8-phosphate phosphatase [Crocinitomicaceae bacterium]|nr:3-deoxy-D-manno-octulosonate 8-phosphate phosphatase [Crocinitomicaceae bacterium]|tara:strand:- start:20147 stop:20677 length:531 start_codon:yes stop_codon:yes gene_type:complete
MNYLDILPAIKTFVFDVDGVLTDGSVALLENGGPVRTMNARDAYALQLAVKKGYEVIIITGGNSSAVKDRLANLGIEHIYLKVSDKRDVFEEHTLAFDTDPNTSLYMGDDIPDFEVMKDVALACCPNDASPEIKAISVFISTRNGGKGCVRDIIEQTLKVQNNWFLPEKEFESFTW